MLSNFEITIGIEVHTVVKTKTKMFSPAKNDHHSTPNSNVNVIDLGLPGIMPQPNKEAVKKAIWLAKELGMEIDYKNIAFDRKNYFYIDLPKGFQITQQYHPIGRNGKIKVGEKEFTLERIHMEEDTAKQTVRDGKIYLDYNRCGAPLVEIVSRPCMHSAEDAMLYLQRLRQILQFNEISDAKMEDGSMRADVNLSIRPFGQKTFGTKVEIKNINSIANVGRAIQFEAQRQAKLWLLGQKLQQQTRMFNDQTGETVYMREKTDAVSYRYIVETNIITIDLPDEDFQTFIRQKPISLDEKIDSWLKAGLSHDDVELLLNNYEMSLVWNKLSVKSNDSINAFKWLSQDWMGYMKKDGRKFSSLEDDTIAKIAQMMQLLKDEEINGKQAKIILKEIYDTNKDPLLIIKEQGFVQIKDENTIQAILEKIIVNNPKMVDQYHENPFRGEKFFIGMVMKETNGQANPKITVKVLKYLLN